jgi:hypothetical protein
MKNRTSRIYDSDATWAEAVAKVLTESKKETFDTSKYSTATVIHEAVECYKQSEVYRAKVVSLLPKKMRI